MQSLEKITHLIIDMDGVLYKGDRADTDILGGKRAGLFTICVLSGSSDREEAEAFGSDMIVDDIAHLLEIGRHQEWRN